MNKRLEGRDETILEPELAIIDAHQHLLERPGLSYSAEDYLAETRLGHKVVASVYVEMQTRAYADGPEVLRPLGEVEFADSVAAASRDTSDACQIAAAIVGYADMRLGAEVGQLLDRCMAAAPERFRGVRQVTIEHPSEAPFRTMAHRPPSGILRSAGFRPAFAELARRGLSFDAAVFSNQLPELADLADAFPDTTIILNHMGTAMGLEMSEAERAELYIQWGRALRDLAQRDNVVCKVGGLGLPTWGFGLDQRLGPVGYLELAKRWRPYVETAIDAFGESRCMMESNFPMDGRSCGCVPLWNALKHIARGCSQAQKSQLFHGTAARVYRMELEALVPTPDTSARSPSPGFANPAITAQTLSKEARPK